MDLQYIITFVYFVRLMCCLNIFVVKVNFIVNQTMRLVQVITKRIEIEFPRTPNVQVIFNTQH